ncbi:MAG: DNA polymerase III subunit gamma/tau [Shewanellaceae bacterium]|nr:DNA polymerase III subunit gamma/tau [Shewanellaceae bacterium]
MSSQVLARKWRPNTFSEVVGQQHVLSALTHALEHGRLHHAYLFSGTRGIGKTSLARLFAKSLNCEQGVTPSPCGTCGNCTQIQQNRLVDLIEIDAASRTKVDDTREILDNVPYLPTQGRYKIYLIDEVHMLSRSSFNALLKTLEEPPAHVVFLLATTEPHKLPMTVLSRCLQFHLKCLDTDQIQTQLQHILTHETIVYEAEALANLSRAAQGSMRDALSLTDQAIACGGGQVRLAAVHNMLGSVDMAYVTRLMQALVSGSCTALFEEIHALLAMGVEADALVDGLLEKLHALYLLQAVPASQSVFEDDLLPVWAATLSSQQVQVWYEHVLKQRAMLTYAPDAKIGLDMLLLPLLATEPVSTVAPVVSTEESNLLAEVSAIEEQAQPQVSRIPSAPPSVVSAPPHRVDPTPSEPTAPVIAPTNTNTNVEVESPNTEAASLLEQVIAMKKMLRTQIQTSSLEQPQTATAASSQSIKEVSVPPAEMRVADPPPASFASIDAPPWTETPPAAVVDEIVQPSVAPSPTSTDGESLVMPAFHAQDLFWYEQVVALALGGRVQQLLLNATLEQTESTWRLHVQPEQQHLLQPNIEASVRAALPDVKLVFEIQSMPGRQTPLAMRAQLHQHCQALATQQLTAAPMIQQWIQRFDAYWKPDSIQYPKSWIDSPTQMRKI